MPDSPNTSPPTHPRASIGIDIGGTSTKLVWLDESSRLIHQATTEAYSNPSRERLAGAIRAGLRLAPDLTEPTSTQPVCIGLCVPGQFDPGGETVRFAANLDTLCGMHVPSFLRTQLGLEAQTLCVMADAQAAATGSWKREPTPGRMLALAMGTGVGAAVLDDGRPVTLGPNTVGHIGQIDVSLTPDAPIGPCGGRGSLEAYIGLPALRTRFGESSESVRAGITSMPDGDPALLALARAIRIAHAIYTPDSVRLLGGIGIAFEPRLVALKRLVDEELTGVAHPGWTLSAANDPYLAALGAAVSASAESSGELAGRFPS